MLLSEEVQRFLTEASSVPVKEMQKNLSRDFLAKIQDYSSVTFEFLVTNRGEYQKCGFCALSGLDNGYFQNREKYLREMETVFIFAESRIKGHTPWTDIFTKHINIKNLGLIHSGMTTSSGMKNWRTIFLNRDVNFSDAVAESFLIEIFQNRAVLTRNVHSSSTEKFIQGFLINEEKITAELSEKLQGTFPGAKILFSPDTRTADISPCGFPLKFTSGTLPEEIVAQAELRSFRILLAGIWGIAVVVSLAALLGLRVILRTSEQRRIFAATVVHDLRSPVAGIDALANSISTECKNPEDIKSVAKKLNTLISRIKDLSTLLDNTLLFSRLADNKQDLLSFSEKTLGEILPPIFEQLSERMERDGGDFDARILEDVAHAQIRTSTIALERILFNLADNAAKHAATGTPPILTISAKLCRNVKFLEMRISDNGSGLSEHAKKNLFREFSITAKDATESGVHGLGIGLALSKRLALTLGGDLVLEKSDSSGTTFCLIIKCK